MCTVNDIVRSGKEVVEDDIAGSRGNERSVPCNSEEVIVQDDVVTLPGDVSSVFSDMHPISIYHFTPRMPDRDG